MESCKLIVMGASMGGITAVEKVLSRLPGGFQTPVAIVMHRSVDSTEGLVQTLRKHTSLRLREPHDKEPIEPGCVYFAPPDYHLMVEPGTFALSTDAPELYARPSIDVLFETAADAYGPDVVAVVMTGASSDGARGAAKVKEFGGVVVVQDPASAEAPLMPQSAIRMTQTDKVLSLDGIGEFLSSECGVGNEPNGDTAKPSQYHQ